MFSNIIFIIIILLLSNFTLELDPKLWILPLPSAVALFVVVYSLLLLCIVVNMRLLKRYCNPNNHTFIINLFILVFFIASQFFLGFHRILNEIPIISNFDSFKILFLVTLYFIALGFYYFLLQKSSNIKENFFQAWQPLQFLLPFVIPFFLITFFFDLISNLSPDLFFFDRQSEFVKSLMSLFLSISLMMIISLFLPPLIVRLWKCKPLEDLSIKDPLEKLCQKAKFTHAGLRIWTLMKFSLTAAIIGILPRFRYVIFTQRLLQELSPQATEAVLAHEIGHNYHKHLLIFPYILMGIPLSLGIASLFFGDALATWFDRRIEVNEWEYETWILTYAMTLFLLIIGTISLYIRFIFGLFSRLFERQADLYGFKLGIDPHYMIEALHTIGMANGVSLSAPNWHHYSIQKRIDFLNACVLNLKLIEKHHRKTKMFLLGYSSIFLLCTSLIISPKLSFLPGFSEINSMEMQISNYITLTLNKEF